MNFIDHVRIWAKAGNGGNGSVHFRQGRNAGKGGPDGGDGGHGGNILMECNAQYWTLLHLRYRKHIRGVNGEAGSGQNKTGARGKNTHIVVPLGTEVRDEKGTLLAQAQEHGQTTVLLRGGKGGKGNLYYAHARHQAPERAKAGGITEPCTLEVELKLLADVGLVGLPNAGKSTLLRTVSAATPEVAGYPFTTLVPELGVVRVHEEHSFVMADLPGIIAGAAEGKGLGLRFLRHMEHTRVLLMVIAVSEELEQTLKQTHDALKEELRSYGKGLLDKPMVLAVS